MCLRFFFHLFFQDSVLPLRSSSAQQGSQVAPQLRGTVPDSTNQRFPCKDQKRGDDAGGATPSAQSSSAMAAMHLMNSRVVALVRGVPKSFAKVRLVIKELWHVQIAATGRRPPWPKGAVFFWHNYYLTEQMTHSNRLQH